MVSKTTYNSKIRSKDANKIEVNNLLFDAVLQAQSNSFFSRPENSRALVLDTSELLTTDVLVRSGIPKNYIEIPNFDKSEFKKLKRVHSTSYFMSLSEYVDMIGELDSADKPKFDIMFLDYCCSIYGNKETNPENDIEKIFEKNLIADRAILATTFSFRSGKGRNYEAVSRADNIITAAARFNEFTCVKYAESKAYNGMFFTMYYLEKFNR